MHLGKIWQNLRLAVTLRNAPVSNYITLKNLKENKTGKLLFVLSVFAKKLKDKASHTLDTTYIPNQPVIWHNSPTDYNFVSCHKLFDVPVVALYVCFPTWKFCNSNSAILIQ